MGQTQPLELQIASNLVRMLVSPTFAGERIWLTCYLSGAPESLHRLAEELGRGGWANTEGWEDGFIYPKLKVRKSMDAILEVAHAVQNCCHAYDADILSIDADTSADVKSSQFVTLFRS
jgi:hypothetical protein